MSTRGVWGFFVDGQSKLAYNHSDSYPSGLGVDLVEDMQNFAKSVGLVELPPLARKLRLVKETDKPTAADIKKLRHFADTSVGAGKVEDWYCLLRQTQSDFAKTLEAGVMVDASPFIKESLFCEWGYVINLDDNLFEVYKGFQREPHKKGRYASETASTGGKDKFYPCALVATFPLNAIPKNALSGVERQHE